MSDQCLTCEVRKHHREQKFVRRQTCVQNRINQSLLVARAWSMLAGFSRLQLARLPLRQASTARLRLCGGVKFASDCCLLFEQPALGQPSWQARSGQSRPLSRAYAASSAAKDAAEEQPDTSLPPGLYLVGTPIGNLEDLSIRALKILQNATVILAEDTRHSRKLLNHYGIKAHMHSFHQHNEHSKQVRVSVARCHTDCIGFGFIYCRNLSVFAHILRCWSNCPKELLWLLSVMQVVSFAMCLVLLPRPIQHTLDSAACHLCSSRRCTRHCLYTSARTLQACP